MKSMIYTLSPLPMIDTITQLCAFMKDHSQCLERDSLGEAIRVPLTSFQKQILELNRESILYLHSEPYHREKLVEYYINPMGTILTLHFLTIFRNSFVKVCIFSL